MSKDMKKAIKLARKRIPLLSDKALDRNLGYFCGTLADAYRQGVYEAQDVILARLLAELDKKEALSTTGESNG